MTACRDLSGRGISHMTASGAKPPLLLRHHLWFLFNVTLSPQHEERATAKIEKPQLPLVIAPASWSTLNRNIFS
jgi:hypothetical protein